MMNEERLFQLVKRFTGLEKEKPNRANDLYG